MSGNAATQPVADYHTTLSYTGFERILSPEACSFLLAMHDRFSHRLEGLLAARTARQQRFDTGELPDFLPQTRHVRESHWRIGSIPEDLRDRRVEITGPVDRKMVINALNSGARVFMADFEDAHSPTWEGTLEGQQNLFDAVRRRIAFTGPEGRQYTLGEQTATLVVRPRGLHLPEKHFLVRGHPIPAPLFDFGLYLFHNATELRARGSGPYFYLPKLESHLEARWWNEVFLFAQQELELPPGSIKVTVLIETLPAAFEMDEILFELRDHITGLNCGRWDYIFSFIKRLHAHADCLLPDRGQVTMTTHFLRSYSRLLIRTCHRRGAYAMGGMAAQIPVKDDALANAQAFAKVRADKEREAGDGHDGTWVAHPGLVPVAQEVFDRIMPGPNQLDRPLEDIRITAGDLLQVPEGRITQAGVRNNVSAALRYLAAWLSGRGAVPIHHLMEDAATAEIARAQLWQWLHHGASLDDGRPINHRLIQSAIADEMSELDRELGMQGLHDGHYVMAAALLRDIVLQPEFEEFLTLRAYARLT